MSNAFMEEISPFLFPWNENTTTKSISSTRCCHISIWHSAWLFFFFNNCWYKMCCRAKLIWQQRAFKSSVIYSAIYQNQNTAKNNFVLVINNGCLEGWDLFGTRLPPPKLHPLQSSDCLCLWCVAEQKQGFMFSLLLKFSIKQNQFVLDTWICWRVRFTPFVFCFVFCILF